MKDRSRREDHEPQVIVEYAPERRNEEERPGSTRRFYYYHYSGTKPLSPFRLAVWAAAGLVILCLLLAIGGTVLLLAVAGGFLYAVWRRLAGKR